MTLVGITIIIILLCFLALLIYFGFKKTESEIYADKVFKEDLEDYNRIKREELK